MGILSAAIGGAANAASDIASGQIKANHELDIRRQLIAMEEEKQIRAEERLRSTNLSNAQSIQEGAAGIQDQRVADAINAKNNSSMSAEDAQVLRDNPAARKAYGLDEPTELQKTIDMAQSAGNQGILSQQKEYYDRAQGIENSDYQKGRNEILDKKADATFEHQKEQDRLNGLRTEAQIALMKTQAEKQGNATDAQNRQLQFNTLKENLGVASNMVTKAQGDLLKAREGMPTPAELASYQTAVDTAQQKYLEASGQLKSFAVSIGAIKEDAKPANFAPDKPPPEALDYLIKNPGAKDAFIEKYGKYAYDKAIPVSIDKSKAQTASPKSSGNTQRVTPKNAPTKQSKEARIAELTAIIDAPTVDWSKGLIGSAKGAQFKERQENAKKERASLLAGE